jgi:hypothetical protein
LKDLGKQKEASLQEVLRMLEIVKLKRVIKGSSKNENCPIGLKHLIIKFYSLCMEGSIGWPELRYLSTT